MGHKNMNQKDYQGIKDLHAAGLSYHKIAKLLSRGITTIQLVVNSPDLASYKTARAEMTRNYRQKVKNPETLGDFRVRDGAVITVKEDFPKPGFGPGSRKRTTEKEYQTIKNLQELGLSSVKIHEIVGRSNSTVVYAMQSSSFEEFRARGRERVAKKPTVVPVLEQAPVEMQHIPTEAPITAPIPTDTIEPSTQQFDFRVLNDNLVLLSDNLKNYADAVHRLEIAVYAMRKTIKEPADTAKRRFF